MSGRSGMRTVLVASLRRNTRRYVASAVAVVIGVAFVMVTNGIASAMRAGLTADTGAPFEGVELVVEPDTDDDVDALLARAAEDGTPVGVQGFAMERVVLGDKLLAEAAYVGEVASDPSVRWQQLEEGRFPSGPGEGVADVNDAKTNGVGVGDVVSVGSGRGVVEIEVVGVVDTPAMGSASLYVPWSDLSSFDGSLWVQSLAWGGSEQAVTEAAPKATVLSSADHVAALQAEIVRGVDYLAIVALLFVGIALFVAVMVIANTFSILFAQRTRDFALLRCVGVTRRQLRRSVRLEALALGLVASTLGVLAGMAAALGLAAVLGRWFPAVGAVSFSPVWAVGAVAVGTLVTLGAAWLPTRAVTRVAPLAALRPDTGVDVRSGAGRLRLALAALSTAAGTGLLVLAVADHDVLSMMAGGSLVFLGVLLLGPVLVPALIRLVGGLMGHGPVRRLATDNAVRNPRRTATTAASLLVGVTLTTAVLTGLDTSRSAVDDEMDLSHPVDATVTAVDAALPEELADRVRTVEGVADVVLLDGAEVDVVGAGPVRLLGVHPEATASVVHGSRSMAPADGVVRLPYSVVGSLSGPATRQWTRDGTVTVRFGPDRTRELQVETGESWGSAGLVSAATLGALSPQAEPSALWVRAEDGADPEDLAGDLTALASGPGAEVTNGYGERAWVTTQINVLTGSVVGLLGVAVVIALVGIANTLGLSVLERSRENALLRAMGLTRTQLRRSMACEGVLLSVVATLLGTALGVAFAWVGVKVMVSSVVTTVAMTLPMAQLVAVFAVAALAGLAACILPARRAGLVAPAAGLALE